MKIELSALSTDRLPDPLRRKFLAVPVLLA